MVADDILPSKCRRAGSADFAAPFCLVSADGVPG